jgi:ornithine carbamoyltransferase
MTTADTRGHDAVIGVPWSAVYGQAENRLHGCKAVMALTMS